MSKEKTSGVNIKLGDEASKIAQMRTAPSFSNLKKGWKPVEVYGKFASIFEKKGTVLGITSDGIGTKVEIAERCGIYNTLGFDLVAMVSDDLVCHGVVPQFLSNVLDVSFIDLKIVDTLMEGLEKACDFAGIVISGGEIAELGLRVAGYGEKMHINWSATCVGFADSVKKVITGFEISPGDVLITIRSNGFRCNGFTKIRMIMKQVFGKNWENNTFQGRTWGEILLTPAKIYTPVIVSLLEKNFRIKSIAHITGGGIFRNLLRVLKPKRLGAYLPDLFEPYDFMEEIKTMGKVSAFDAYYHWNMGNGMIVCVEKHDAENVVRFLNDRSYEAKIAGSVVLNQKISIKNTIYEY